MSFSLELADVHRAYTGPMLEGQGSDEDKFSFIHSIFTNLRSSPSYVWHVLLQALGVPGVADLTSGA
jgi:hypothetical protein